MAIDAARGGAVRLIGGVLGESRLILELVADGALAHLAPDDRARAQRLANETLRWLERIDRILSKHLRKMPPLAVRNVLRLATLELCQGGAAHGVVNDAVERVSGMKRHAAFKGLTNAVLRKVAGTGPEQWRKLRAPQLPKWLRKPLVEAWGTGPVGAMEQAHAAGAPIDLSVKPGTPAPQGEVLPTGSIRLQQAGQISALPGFSNGDWWVQDAAAALPVKLLQLAPDERVLDMCAAPGGKTMQLAAAGAEVTAVDISETRMERVRENLDRTGLDARLQVCDALKLTGQWDSIVLDAPCSATGTIRRHPDLPHAKDGSAFGELIELQSRMLDHAWSLLRPGGRMVYCTCSLLPDEGEVQIEEAMARHEDMSISKPQDIPGILPAWREPLGGLRLRPDFWAERGGMDGFYIALLEKAG